MTQLSETTVAVSARPLGDRVHELLEANNRYVEYARCLREALDLALSRLGPLEPGHSCAVSDEFVAMYAVSCGDHSDRVMDVIRKAKK
ncbi:MAG: hypothetical protein JWM36_1128 [Hyphomicrobiales bacterium]|nr:hypothetical protein [Hyphomicrobiales bacterium]